MSQPTFEATRPDAILAEASRSEGRRAEVSPAASAEIDPTEFAPTRASVMPAAPKISRTAKSQYSESEAAVELGISVDALRQMIRSHVMDSDQDANNIPATTFQPSDLLVLRLLAGRSLFVR